MATKETSQHKKDIIRFVSDKLENKREKIESLGSDSDKKAQHLNDYALVFTGALDVLEALGLPEEELRPVTLVLESVETELAALEKEAALERMLKGED